MTDPDRTAQTLRRIASALNCTVEDLMVNQEPASEVLEVDELLRLWNAIDSPAGRRIVLKAAHDVVRSQVAGASASP